MFAEADVSVAVLNVLNPPSAANSSHALAPPHAPSPPSPPPCVFPSLVRGRTSSGGENGDGGPGLAVDKGSSSSSKSNFIVKGETTEDAMARVWLWTPKPALYLTRLRILFSLRFTSNVSSSRVVLLVLP